MTDRDTPQNNKTIQDAPKGLLTYDEAMAYLRISRSKLYNLIRLGELSVTNLGSRCPRLRFGDVQRLAERGAGNG